MGVEKYGQHGEIDDKPGAREGEYESRMNRSCLRLILLLTLTLAGCDGAREPAPESRRPALDYSWVATTPRAELAGHYDRANVFIYADYYRRQRAYASGEIPPRLLSDAYTSHPLAYYTLKREPAVRTPAASGGCASGRSGSAALPARSRLLRSR